jgi:peptidoglycan/LPS O-acetylase OafA/YrhL
VATQSERTPAVHHGQREYYERLQSFRGFGVLMVAFFHCQGVIGGELSMRPAPEHGLGTAPILAHYISLAVLNGHAALMAFFVLSGFVLTLSLRRGPQGGLPASFTFTTARLFRIVPANAVAVLVAVAMAATARATRQASVPPPWSWSPMLANMLLVETTINPVAWSLTVEMLAVPFIVGMFLVTRRHGPTPLVLVAAVTLCLSFAPSWIGHRPLGRNLFVFFLGMLVAELGPRLAGTLNRKQAARWFVLALVVWFPTRALLGRWSHFASVAEAFAAATMMALIAYGPQLSSYRWFELRPVLWLGEISYSLYLYHFLLMGWFAFPPAAPPFVTLGGWAPLAALFAAWAVTVAAAIPASWLSYAAVEQVSIGVGRVCTRRVLDAAARLRPLPT